MSPNRATKPHRDVDGSEKRKRPLSRCGSHSIARGAPIEGCKRSGCYRRPFSGSCRKDVEESKKIHQPERDPDGKGSSIKGSRSSGSLIVDGSCGSNASDSAAEKPHFHMGRVHHSNNGYGQSADLACLSVFCPGPRAWCDPVSTCPVVPSSILSARMFLLKRMVTTLPCLSVGCQRAM